MHTQYIEYQSHPRIAPRYIAVIVAIILCFITYMTYGGSPKSELLLCQESYMKAMNAVYRQNDELMAQCKKESKDIHSLAECTKSALEIPKNTCSNSMSATGGKAPEPPKSSKNICTIGTGSHDLRPMAKDHPGVAGWKNNNTSGLTIGSKKLQQAFDEAGISWEVGTARPSREGSYYYNFPDIENGLKAKILIIKRSYMDSTITQFLRTWGTDSIHTNLDRSRRISSLDDGELLSLIRSQIQKESGKAMVDYIFDPKNKIIVCLTHSSEQ